MLQVAACGCGGGSSDSDGVGFQRGCGQVGGVDSVSAAGTQSQGEADECEGQEIYFAAGVA